MALEFSSFVPADGIHEVDCAVRRWLWTSGAFARAGHQDLFNKLPEPLRRTLLYALAPAAGAAIRNLRLFHSQEKSSLLSFITPHFLGYKSRTPDELLTDTRSVGSRVRLYGLSTHGVLRMGTERRGQSERLGAESRSASCTLVRRNMGRLPRKLPVFGLAALLITGCSSPSERDGPLTTEQQAIMNVGLAYREASRALRRGPVSAKELQPYLKKYGDPEKLLISPNDGQPYHIVWGLIPSQPTKNAQTNRFLAYEQTGKDGKRYALDCMLKVHHLTDKEFNRLRGPS
jgi:hypothetical protein